MLQGNCVTKWKYLLKNEINFDIFQLFSGQFDGLNQTLWLTELQKSNKIFQPNLGSGQSLKVDFDFNRGKNTCECRWSIFKKGKK